MSGHPSFIAACPLHPCSHLPVLQPSAPPSPQQWFQSLGPAAPRAPRPDPLPAGWGFRLSLRVPGTWTSAGSAPKLCREANHLDFFACLAFTQASLSRSSFCICLGADSKTSLMQISLPACRSWAELSMYRDAFRSREPKIRLLMPRLAPES